jgi:hypothetical protein
MLLELLVGGVQREGLGGTKPPNSSLWKNTSLRFEPAASLRRKTAPNTLLKDAQNMVFGHCRRVTPDIASTFDERPRLI